MKLRTSLLISFIFAAALSISATTSMAPETLTYKVMYKWGMIHKQAGTATFRLTASGANYNAVVTARSDPWADKVYHLRDTLRARFATADFSPHFYERLAHEDGKFSHDVLRFTHSGGTYSATCTRERRKKGQKELTTASTKLTAQGMTVDLLTSFYYLRSLKFGTMNPGSTVKLNIFSGKRKELLTITYSGISSLKIDGKNHQVYKVKFTFTSDGRKQTSDPIEVWLSMDSRQIPLKLVGKLKIGQVQCIYTGKI